ncbi:MAG: EAL domain-containing response regulator [Rubrivivax sp.]|nr:EAL domain-containing response regulator [Rubrivivax sp.]
MPRRIDSEPLAEPGAPTAAATLAPADAAAAGPAAQPGILLLDDDPFMLSVHSLMLRGMGLQRIVTALRGEDALQSLQSDLQAVDVIVCDLNMPGMDGIEFLQAVDASPYRGSVILLSGEGTRIMHTVQKLLGGGRLQILGALEKPARPAAMQALLERWKPVTAAHGQTPAPVYACEDIHAAVREQQWVLHYQPKVNLRSGALAGVEALVRWQHPLHGLVYPDRFIGLAEDCGAIDALTDWVLRESTRQLTRWQREGLPMPIAMAVNVSMENLRQPGFSRRLGALMREAGVPPQDMTLEITESRLMAPSPAPLESLVRLRLQRFGLSIDDFGTGHSSLAQLRDVPFTELKVDRGFVQGASGNPIIRPMLEASIGIAKRLGMQSVAEGVETAEDWQLLREIGCDLAQGYFIARPMASDRLAAWLDDWRGHSRRLLAPP